ncbi:hypothetical protein BC830DRAFT_1119887 [Chytriomyces sp. MP71]|nr:hypothetical protein BC830DRAFT_1119887 [Chytriomyces sp. MP71]
MRTRDADWHRARRIRADKGGPLWRGNRSQHRPLAQYSSPQWTHHELETGGAIGLYANGLAVLRDIDNTLLDAVVAAGMPYERRRWMRHDGTEIAVGDETKLVPSSSSMSTPDSTVASAGLEHDARLHPIGIRRWKFQAALFAHAKSLNIKVHFNKRLASLEHLPSGATRLHFTDSTTTTAKLLFGADGVKSQVRAFLFPDIAQPAYTGVTTLMAVARVPDTKLQRGIHFISSRTSKFHACMYPLPDNEVNVQIYLPMPENPETWGKLNPDEMRSEAAAMARKLRADGWSETFVEPWLNPDSVIRVGLRARAPLEKWSEGKIVLLGDAAHPPVPYIGQGAMQAIEDAGVLALLVKKLCVTSGPSAGASGKLNLDRFDQVKSLYEQIRVARCTQVLQNSHVLGEINQRRADSFLYNLQYEWSIWGQVFLYGNLPIMLQGVQYKYSDEVDKVVAGLDQENGGIPVQAKI